MKCGQKKLENKEFSGKTDCRRHPNAPQSMKNQVKSTESTILLSACCYPLLLLYTAIVFIHLFIVAEFLNSTAIHHQCMRTMKTVVFIRFIFALFIASVTSRFVLRGQ